MQYLDSYSNTIATILEDCITFADYTIFTGQQYNFYSGTKVVVTVFD